MAPSSWPPPATRHTPQSLTPRPRRSPPGCGPQRVSSVAGAMSASTGQDCSTSGRQPRAEAQTQSPPEDASPGTACGREDLPPQRCDVAVVGGGILGLALAREL